VTNNSYPADAGSDLYLLTVMGVPKTTTAAEAREVHNATAGNPEGVEGAKSLGDLSHNVYLPADGSNRLMFLDNWNTPTGVGTFFANEQVQQGADVLWAEREAVLWMRADGFGSYHLPASTGGSVGAIGIMRAPVSSYDAARDAFHADSVAKINASRRFGLLAHTLWVPLQGDTQEVFGVDYWMDADAMNEWYAQAEYDSLGVAFTGAPESSTLLPAGKDWIEW
jgi:hypothetical protein